MSTLSECRTLEERVRWVPYGRAFRVVAAVILGIAGPAKIWSAMGSSKVLQLPDPIFGISSATTLTAVGMVECGVAVACALERRPRWSLILVAWLSGSFLTYRFGLSWIGWHRPCPCLGVLTEAIGVPPEVASKLMLAVALLLLWGSYSLLLGQRRLGGAGAV